jgi:hypothetical protein
MYKEDKFGGGFGVLLLILECGSESQRLSILQIFGCHITGLSLLLVERRWVNLGPTDNHGWILGPRTTMFVFNHGCATQPWLHTNSKFLYHQFPRVYIETKNTGNFVPPPSTSSSSIFFLDAEPLLYPKQ